MSNNPHCNHERRLLARVLVPVVEFVLRSSRLACLAIDVFSSSLVVVPNSSGIYYALLRQLSQQRFQPLCLDATMQMLVDVVFEVARVCRRVS